MNSDTVVTVDRIVAFVSAYYANEDFIWNTIMTPKPPDVVAVAGSPEAGELVMRALDSPGRPNITCGEDPLAVPRHPDDRLLVFINPEAPDGRYWWDAAAAWCRARACLHLETS